MQIISMSIKLKNNVKIIQIMGHFSRLNCDFSTQCSKLPNHLYPFIIYGLNNYYPSIQLCSINSGAPYQYFQEIADNMMM